eukprot:snap_masked-scaffold_4-processed-gene-17.20-mRNA-1 protein AED:1.00 eAED:1.00 QI:0/-1/0/0/-1/1/1/0/205
MFFVAETTRRRQPRNHYGHTGSLANRHERRGRLYPDPKRKSMVQKSIENNSEELFKLLMLNEAEIKGKDFQGKNALHTAAEENRINFIKPLVDRDESMLEAKNNDCHTPLSLACKRNSHHAAFKLLALGANPHEVLVSPKSVDSRRRLTISKIIWKPNEDNGMNFLKEIKLRSYTKILKLNEKWSSCIVHMIPDEIWINILTNYL